MQTAWSISTERRKDNCGESSLSQAQHCASQTPNIQLVHSSPDSCNAFFTAIVSISCLWPWWEKEGVLWKIDYQRHWAHLLSFPSASWNVFVCRLGSTRSIHNQGSKQMGIRRFVTYSNLWMWKVLSCYWNLCAFFIFCLMLWNSFMPSFIHHYISSKVSFR